MTGFVQHGDAKGARIWFLSSEEDGTGRLDSILERSDMICEFDGGDVIGEVDQQTCVFVVRASEAEGVCHAEGFLFHHVVDALARQTSAHVLGDLTDETIGDDGDVLNARTTDGSQCIVDDGAFVDGQEGLLCVACERRQTASMAARNEDGLDVHVPRIRTLFKAPPVPTFGSSGGRCLRDQGR